MDDVPFFIRFSEELVEDARSIGMPLFQESSHKTVEKTMRCIQRCLGPEADENDDDEDDGRLQKRGHGTQSPNASPDADDRDGPASIRQILHETRGKRKTCSSHTFRGSREDVADEDGGKDGKSTRGCF